MEVQEETACLELSRAKCTFQKKSGPRNADC